MKTSAINSIRVNKYIQAVVLIGLTAMVLMQCIGFVWAAGYTDDAPYEGFPRNVTIQLSDLDTSGSLIYVGVDLAVFQDEDGDGEFAVMSNKVVRKLTNSTNVTLDLGSIADYEKGKLYKVAMRTLYVPTGTDNDLIVVADQDNGKDGWVLLPGLVFRPTYFINGVGSPYLLHTDKWDENRLEYNASKVAAGLDSSQRSEDIFWSGEKFVFDIHTSEAIPGGVRISIDGTEYSTTLTTPTSVTSSGAIYQGELWDEEMYNKWGNYAPETLTFSLDAMDNSTILETKKIQAIIDNQDQYYRTRREF